MTTQQLRKFERSLGDHFREQIIALGGSADMIGDVSLTQPKEVTFGDFTTNCAFQLVKPLRRPPRLIALKLIDGLIERLPSVSTVDVASNGFINLTMSWEFWQTIAYELLTTELVSPIDPNDHCRIQIEFVSANPTGPLNVVNARAAVIGDTLGNIFRRCGYGIEKEFLINDAGLQTHHLGKSLRVRVEQELGRDATFPEDGYPGDYLIDFAKQLCSQRQAPASLLEESDEFFRQVAIDSIVTSQQTVLEKYRVVFDRWFSEKSLHESGELDQTRDELQKRGQTYDDEGALWLRTSAWGDEKDRVLVKSNRDSTYFLADIAYHRNKMRRGFDVLINIWGPDHHGHIARMKAALAALGYGPERLEVLIAQQVNLLRDGQRVKMTKRGGRFILMDELIDEVGTDAARFFFLLRRTDSHLDFDLDLATKKNKDNPVYYLQYAFARISSIFRKAKERGIQPPDPSIEAFHGLQSPLERQLLQALSQYASVLHECARTREPHRLAFYLIGLANLYHKFQHDHRVMTRNQTVQGSRLLLLKTVRRVFADAFDVLGIRALETM